MVEPTGYTALDLIGFTDKGSYDPLANYVRNDLVHVGNSTWRCKIDDTTGITPTEGANWTIFIESATSLAGMSDVNITTPTKGDLLQYNSANNEWVNSSDVWDTMTQNGAHNWFNLTASTQTVNGATFTMNSNGRGSITISGKHTYANAQSIVLGYVRNVKAGDSFIFNGIENAFTSASIDLRFYNSNDESLGYTTYWSGDLSITVPANTSYIKVTIYFNNQDFGTGVTIYPMLRLATDHDPTFASHAMTNRELTEKAIDFGYVEKDIAGISVNNAADGKYYAIINFSLPAGAVPISVMWGGNGGWQANVSFMLHRGVSAYQVFAIADTAVTISSTNRVIWIFYIKPSIS